MENTSLDSILDNTPPEAPPEPPEQPRAADGKFASETPTETPAPVEEAPKPVEATPEIKAAIARANDERTKRQAIEKELAEFKAKYQTPAPVEEKKAFWDDPEAALKNHEKQIHSIAINTKLSTSEAIARSAHPDFDEKIAVFKEVLERNPHLAQEWLSQADPAAYAYKVGKSHLELKEAGSIDELKKKIEAETRVKLEAEYKAKAEEQAKQRQAIPGSLSEVHNTQVNKPVWSGPTPLTAILK